jgi:PAS domain S-box-containing protein
MTTSIPEMSIGYQQVVEALGDAVVICDPDGVIRVWNVAAERLFGFTKTDALGKSLDLIIPERLRERHWAGYDKAMASGEKSPGRDLLRVPGVHKDGRALSIAFTVGLLFGPQGKVTGIAAVIRDDSDHFAKERESHRVFADEEELRKALNESLEEAQRLSAYEEEKRIHGYY